MREPHWHPETAEMGYVRHGRARMTPGDIGYRATASAYSREVLAATFGVPKEALPDLPFTAEDPLIVDRKNPVDPAT